MLIDVIGLILLLLAIFKGLRKGFIVALFSFVAFVVGLAAAMKLSAFAADYIGKAFTLSQRWLPVLAFFAVFFIVVLLIRLGARMIEGAIQVAMLGWLNRLAGVALYVLIYLFIFSIILFYAVQLKLVKEETLQASFLYPYIQPLGPVIIKGLGAVIPFFKDMFGELLQFFEGVTPKEQGP